MFLFAVVDIISSFDRYTGGDGDGAGRRLLRQVLQLTTFDCRLYLSISSSIGLKMMEIETIIEMLDANLIDNHKFVRLTVGFCDNLNN